MAKDLDGYKELARDIEKKGVRTPRVRLGVIEAAHEEPNPEESIRRHHAAVFDAENAETVVPAREASADLAARIERLELEIREIDETIENQPDYYEQVERQRRGEVRLFRGWRGRDRRDSA